MITKNLENFKKQFEKELTIFFDTKLQEAEKTGEYPKEMIEVVKEFTLRGGKRIRPALIYYTYKCFDLKNEELLFKVGISIELLQSFLLIHDDIIDDDDLRRNMPTVHKIYEGKYGKFYGKNLAILAGDMAVLLAEESILSLDIDSNKKIEILKILNETIQKVVYGQELDILSTKNEVISKDSLFKIHNLKTSKYTFEGPTLVGAVFGNANGRDIEILKEYSYKMGIAFQLQDDILGLFGDEKKLGKPIGSDLKEGKKTLLILKALECSCSNDKKIIDRLIGKKDIQKHEIDLVRDIVKESGSLDYSQKIISEFISESKNLIEKSDFKNEGKDFLLGLCDYLKEREN